MAAYLRAVMATVLVLGGLQGAALGEGTSSSARGRVTLGAVNVIRGNGNGYIEVTIPRAVTIDDSEAESADELGPDASVRGRGRFVGMALVEDPYPGGRNYNRFLMIGRFGGCAEPGCRPTRDAVGVVFSARGLEDDGPRYTLKAGDYRLYLFADGSPAEVKFRLRGLGGHTNLTPTDGAQVDLQTAPDRINAEPAGGRVWSAGSSFEGGQVGFSFGHFTVEADDFTGTEIGVCQYNAFHPPPAEVGYGPHCTKLTPLLGSTGEITFDNDVDERRYSIVASFGYHDNTDGTTGAPNLSGQHGFGAYVRSTQSFQVTPLTAFFLTLK